MVTLKSLADLCLVGSHSSPIPNSFPFAFLDRPNETADTASSPLKHKKATEKEKKEKRCHERDSSLFNFLSVKGVKLALNGPATLRVDYTYSRQATNLISRQDATLPKVRGSRQGEKRWREKKVLVRQWQMKGQISTHCVCPPEKESMGRASERGGGRSEESGKRNPTPISSADHMNCARGH